MILVVILEFVAINYFQYNAYIQTQMKRTRKPRVVFALGVQLGQQSFILRAGVKAKVPQYNHLTITLIDPKSRTPRIILVNRAKHYESIPRSWSYFYMRRFVNILRTLINENVIFKLIRFIFVKLKKK